MHAAATEFDNGHVSMGLAAAETVPWVPLSRGKSFKPLRFLANDRGFVELLRLEPGEAIARHRHSGEVHAFNLQGERELDTGERVGPGGYVHEPEGNVDSWKVIGDEALIVMVVVMGAVEYLDADGKVADRYTASTLRDIYERYCAAAGIPAVDLAE
jgi:quercetin dioxygenase-like cupin family protein